MKPQLPPRAPASDSRAALPGAPQPLLPGQSRYGALAESLRQRVLAGEWSPGQNIPAESALARSYGVALGTMRQALSLLVDGGVLQRQHGRGTSVSRGLDDASLMRFFRFHGAGEHPQTPVSRIVRRRVRRGTADESSDFGLPRGEPVLELERVRSLGGRPCLLETIVLPLPLFDPLVGSDAAQWGDLLYPLYQQRCGVVVHQAQDAFAFAQLGLAQARRLRLPAGHPCVCVRRQAYGIAGDCIERRATRADAWAFTYTAQVR